MKITGFFFLLVLLAFSCSTPKSEDISGIEVAFDFARADILMQEYIQQANEENRVEIYANTLKKDKEFFLSMMGIDVQSALGSVGQSGMDSLVLQGLGQILESENMKGLADTLAIIFPENSPIQPRLEEVLKRLKLHFPEIGFPAFRTHMNGYDPSASLQSIDQVLLLPGYVSIGLHYFLGENFPYYPASIPQYVRKRFRPEYLEVALMKEIGKELIVSPPLRGQPTLLNQMVQQGIKQYYLEKLLPNVPDSVRLSYTSTQIEWANHFEAQIFKELIPKFYEIDYKVHLDFIGEKPHTTSLTNKSAPRLGEYIGWKIVQNYMANHPEVSLSELCQMTDYDLVFKGAKYKPR